MQLTQLLRIQIKSCEFHELAHQTDANLAGTNSGVVFSFLVKTRVRNLDLITFFCHDSKLHLSNQVGKFQLSNSRKSDLSSLDLLPVRNSKVIAEFRMPSRDLGFSKWLLTLGSDGSAGERLLPKSTSMAWYCGSWPRASLFRGIVCLPRVLLAW